MVHDLSGSPVAAASMVTPFVPATGSDYVARSNPGAWLILRPETPGAGSWRPWGRLEAWREKGGKGVGSRFQLLSETGAMQSGVLTSETLFSAKKRRRVHDRCSQVQTGAFSSGEPLPKSSKLRGAFELRTWIARSGRVRDELWGAR